VNGFNSGQLSVYGYIGSMVTPDSTLQLAAIDFVNNGGQIFIQGAESEGSNYRFFVSTSSPGSTNTHLDAISFQSQAPTDNVVIVGGALTIANSLLGNGRAAGSVPFISVGPLFAGTNNGSLVSLGNTYTNTAVGCAGPSCGWLPMKDGSGNIWGRDFRMRRYHAVAGLTHVNRKQIDGSRDSVSRQPFWKFVAEELGRPQTRCKEMVLCVPIRNQIRCAVCRCLRGAC